MQRRDQLRRSPHITQVGNSPLPRLTMLLGQYAPRRERRALRHRSRKRFVIVSAALLLPSARVFLENTFLPRGFGTRSRRKCQPPLYQHPLATLLYREFPICRTRPARSFRRDKTEYVCSAFYYHTRSDTYIYFNQFSPLRVYLADKEIILYVHIFTMLRNS